MKTIQKISGTFVRHNWKEIAEDLSRGKTFIVENHGKTEAILMPPQSIRRGNAGRFDIEKYFKRLMQQPAVSLSAVNAGLSRSPE